MGRQTAKGFCDKDGTCRWCGTKFSVIYKYRPSQRILDRNLPPTRCKVRTKPQWPYICDSRKFVKDPLPNPKPFRCVSCATEYEGRWVNRKQGEREVRGEASRDGLFCTMTCAEAFAQAAILQAGLVLFTVPLPRENPKQEAFFRVTRAEVRKSPRAEELFRAKPRQ